MSNEQQTQNPKSSPPSATKAAENVQEKPLVLKPVTASFVEPVRFGGQEFTSAYLADPGGTKGNIDVMFPARLEADGVPVAITEKQRADGLVIMKKNHDKSRHLDFTVVSFVPFTNVRSISYSVSE